ncbi:MAG: glycosyltransferase family 2 protein [Microscillaceae bacterium]|nr:glycosyltransferase family 2 protein [Microscillaceae bacterium]
MKYTCLYSVVVPVYQGEATLARLFDEIQAFFEGKSQSFEVIFVSDGAIDHSWNLIQQLKEKYTTYIKGVQLTRNFGQHNATLCGIAQAQGRFILTMDEDLQHAPAQIEKLILKQKEKDYDLVYGYFENSKHNFFRRISSKALKYILQWSLPDLHPDYSSFRLIKTEIAQATLQLNHPNPFLDVYLSWVSRHCSSVPVIHYERFQGKSAYTLKKLVRHGLHILFNFSNLPLRAFSYLSFALFLLSTGYALYVFFRKIVYNDFISGFATIAIFLGMGFGLVFLGIGLLGEYIQNINLKTTQKPNFLIKEIL